MVLQVGRMIITEVFHIQGVYVLETTFLTTPLLILSGTLYWSAFVAIRDRYLAAFMPKLETEKEDTNDKNNGISFLYVG